MKRILFISTIPLDSKLNGGLVYTKSIINLLSDDSIVDFISFRKKDYTLLEKKLYQIKSLIFSIISKLPSKVLYFKNRQFFKKVQLEVIKNKYDVLIIDHAELLWILNDLTIDIETIYIAHNIEYILYRKFVNKIKFNYFRNLLKKDAVKYQQYELNNIKLVDKIITISSIDKSYIEKNVENTKVLHLLVTFDYTRLNNKKIKNGIINIAFLGSIDWWPNKEGILWFIENVFLKINTTNLVLNIYGKNNSKLLGELYKNINCYDYVNDISSIWNSNDIFVQPIFSGSGMNIKVAEAIYNNKPLIATKFAIKGIEYKGENGICICNTSEEWFSVFRYDKLTKLSNTSISEKVIRNFDAKFQNEKLRQFLDLQI